MFIEREAGREETWENKEMVVGANHATEETQNRQRFSVQQLNSLLLTLHVEQTIISTSLSSALLLDPICSEE